MKRVLVALALALGLAVSSEAAAFPVVGYVQINPPNAPQPGAFNTSSGTVGSFKVTGLAANQCVQTGPGGALTVTGVQCGTGSGGGGGSSALQVTQSGVQVTSPTASLNFNASVFSLAAVGSTSTINLNSSSVTLQGNNLTATYLTNSSATATYLTSSSATATYAQGRIVGSPQFRIPYYSNSGSGQFLTGDNGGNPFATDGAGHVSADIFTAQGYFTSPNYNIQGLSSVPLAVDAFGYIIADPAALGNVFLGSNQTFTGANTFTAPIYALQGGYLSGRNQIDATHFSTIYATATGSGAGNTVSTGKFTCTRTSAGGGFCIGMEGVGVSTNATDNVWGLYGHSSGPGNNAGITLDASGGATNHAANIIGGDFALSSSAGTNGQVITSGGAGVVPSWTTVSGGGGSLPLPSGATNYVQITNSLQSGSTAYMSSATINSLLVNALSLKNASGNSISGISDNGTGTSGNLLIPQAEFTGTVTADGSLSILGNTSGARFSFIGPLQSTVTYGLSVGSLTIVGAGAGEIDLTEGAQRSGIAGKDVIWGDSSVNWPLFTPNNSGSAYFIMGGSTTVTTGHCAAFSGNGGSLVDGGVCGGGGGGGSGGVVNAAVQGMIPYYSVTGSSNVVSGAANTAVTASSITITRSSFSFTTNGSQNSATPPGVVDIYDGAAVSGRPLFTIGSQNLNNQFQIKDQTALSLSYGVAVQNIQLGFPATPNRLGSNQTANNWVDLYAGEGVTGEMALQTGAVQTRDIVFLPEQTATVRMSSNSVIVISSMVVKGAGGLGVNYGVVASSADIQQAGATTPGTASSYGLGVRVSGQPATLTLGADATFGYIQSWQGALALNSYANGVTVSGSTFTFQNNGLLSVGQINWPNGTTQTSAYPPSFRRPKLIWIDSNTVEMEGGNSDGTATKSCITFPDGSNRCDTETTSSSVHAYRRFVAGQKANWGSVINGGLNPGEVLTDTSTLAFYAVKSTSTATDFTLVGTTLAPVSANYAALNTAFGTSGWLYLGIEQWGDNCRTEALAVAGFVPAYYAGATEVFGGICGGSTGVYAGGIKMANGTGSATYTYSSGMVGGGKIPPNVTLVHWFGNIQSVNATDALFLRDPATFGVSRPDIAYVSPGVIGGSYVIPASRFYPASKSMSLFGSAGAGANLQIDSWIDDALSGVGANPAF